MDHGPIVDNGELAAFEGRCGYPIAPDYRRFLLARNGDERVSVVLSEVAEASEGAPREHQFFSLAAASLPIGDTVVDLALDA